MTEKTKVEEEKAKIKKEASGTEKKIGKGEKSKTKEKENKESKKTGSKKEEKKGAKEIKKPKKSEAVVNAKDVPISTKHSIAVCKFIKGKKIDDAIKELEQVVAMKKSVPMKGEIPHRKGKGVMSGRFPAKTAKNFIVFLKSLSGNATYNSVENPVIVEAVANMGSRPYGRFGRVRKKRTHIKIIAKEIKPAEKGKK